MAVAMDDVDAIPATEQIPAVLATLATGGAIRP
jgi:hypothetical protein